MPRPPDSSASENHLVLDLDAFNRHGIDSPEIHFDRCGYLPLPGLIPTGSIRLLRTEIDRIMPWSSRRDFLMECMDRTPRHMTTIGGVALAERAPAVTELYHDRRLRSAMSQTIGRELDTADDPVERHVLNMLHEPGDTHGFHVDDYPVALVMFIESPNCPDGCGRLEFCPIEDVHRAQTHRHQVGDAYILRSDRLKHRVQPIHDGCRRTVLNFAYAVRGQAVRRTASASMLYD